MSLISTHWTFKRAPPAVWPGSLGRWPKYCLKAIYKPLWAGEGFSHEFYIVLSPQEKCVKLQDTTHLLWEDAPSSHTSDHCRWRRRSQGSWSIWTAHQHLGLCHCVHSSLLRKIFLRHIHSAYNKTEENRIKYSIRWMSAFNTCLLIKVFVVDDDTLSHSLVAHLILECWWNNSVMAFRRVVLLPRLAILILLTENE